MVVLKQINIKDGIATEKEVFDEYLKAKEIKIHRNVMNTECFQIKTTIINYIYLEMDKAELVVQDMI